MPDDNPGSLLLDLDGCTVDEHGDLTEDAKTRIKEAIRVGKTIVIATQRTAAMLYQKAYDAVSNQKVSSEEDLVSYLKNDNDISKALKAIEHLGAVAQVVSGDIKHVDIYTGSQGESRRRASQQAFKRSMTEGLTKIATLTFSAYKYQMGEDGDEASNNTLNDKRGKISSVTWKTKVPHALFALQHGPIDASDDSRGNTDEYQALIDQMRLWPDALDEEGLKEKLRLIAPLEFPKDDSRIDQKWAALDLPKMLSKLYDMKANARKSRVVVAQAGFYTIANDELRSQVDSRPINDPLRYLFKLPYKEGSLGDSLPFLKHAKGDNHGDASDMASFLTAFNKLTSAADRDFVVSHYTQDFFNRCIPAADPVELIAFYQSLSEQSKKVLIGKCDGVARACLHVLLSLENNLDQKAGLAESLDNVSCQILTQYSMMSDYIELKSPELHQAIQDRINHFHNLDRVIEEVKNRQDNHANVRSIKHLIKGVIGMKRAKQRTLKEVNDLQVLTHFEKLSEEDKDEIRHILNPDLKKEQKYRLVKNVGFLFKGFDPKHPDAALHRWKVLDAIASRAKEPAFVASWKTIKQYAELLLGSKVSTSAQAAKLPSFGEPPFADDSPRNVPN